MKTKLPRDLEPGDRLATYRKGIGGTVPDKPLLVTAVSSDGHTIVCKGREFIHNVDPCTPVEIL